MDYVAIAHEVTSALSPLVSDLLTAAVPIVAAYGVKLLREHNVDVAYYATLARGGAIVLDKLTSSGQPVTMDAAKAVASAGVDYVLQTSPGVAAAKGLTPELAPMVLAAEAIRQAVASSKAVSPAT